MALTINDLIDGVGPEYILLTKNKKGKYAIMADGEKIQDILDQLTEIKANALKRIKERKNQQ